MRRFRKFLRLPRADRWLLLESAALLWIVRLGLWLVPFTRLVGLLSWAPQSRCDPATSANRFVWPLQAASRFVMRSTCLVQALALQTILRRRGLEAKLQIGVDKGEGTALDAHAWVEVDGEILLGGPDVTRFKPLDPEEVGSRRS